MKKIISAILILVLLIPGLFLTSCKLKIKEFRGMTPEEAYEYAMDAYEKLDNYTVLHENNVKTSWFFISFGAKVDSVSKHDGRNWEQKMAFDGVEYHNTYIDEVFYEREGFVKNKYNIPYELQDSYITASVEDLLRFPKEWLVDAQFYSEDGETYIEARIDGEAYCEYLFEIDTNEPMEGDPAGDVIYRMYLSDEGEVERVWVKIVYVSTEDIFRIKSTLIDDMVYTDFGTTVVEPPEDADSYTKRSLY